MTYSIIRTWRGENQLSSVDEVGWMNQKLFNENALGSHIDSSQACFFPPSSEKLGVGGRRDFLSISNFDRREYLNEKREEKKLGE